MISLLSSMARCCPRFRRLRHDRQLGDELTASAVIPGKRDALQLRMRSPRIDFGCFEELARVMYQPQPSGPSQKLDPGQDLHLEPTSETFCRSQAPFTASALRVGRVFYAERLMNLADLLVRELPGYGASPGPLLAHRRAVLRVSVSCLGRTAVRWLPRAPRRRPDLACDFRLDRHPSMSRHPTTPMNEADLGRVLENQGAPPCGLVDLRALAGGSAAVAQAIAGERARVPGPIVFDGLTGDDCALVAEAVWRAAEAEPTVVLSAQGFAYGFGRFRMRRMAEGPQAEPLSRVKPVCRLNTPLRHLL